MTHVPLPIAAQSSRAALDAKLVEHDDALNVLEAVNPFVPGTVIDSTMTGLVVDYPLPAAAVLVLMPAGGADFTGLTPGVAGQILDIYNESGSSHNVTFYDSNTNSLAANRLLIATVVPQGDGAAVVLTPGSFARLRFDGTNWWVHVLWNSQAPAAITANGSVTAASVTSNASTWRSGAGAPNSSVVGNVGDLYTDTTGGLLWVKQTGAGTNTGWVSK